jgi:hypothetical protein
VSYCGERMDRSSPTLPMPRRSLSIFAILLVLAVASARAQTTATPPPSNRELAELKTALDSVMKRQPMDAAAYSALMEKGRARVVELIGRDELRTASDFFVASMLSTDPTAFFESTRVQHELALVSLVLGHPDALRRVALSWDGLNWSMGRGQRLGSYLRDGVANNMDPMPAPAVIRNLFKDPASARARAAGATNNAELQRMRDEDQADRSGTLDQATLARLHTNDSLHLARTLRLVAEGVPATGRDMHNVATVLQHGGTPDNYRLAHELSIAAIALGDTTALWLVSRSYDRMLLSMGHRQRLNTQYGGATMELVKLSPLDTTAVNDRIRRALCSRRLADAARPPGN